MNEFRFEAIYNSGFIGRQNELEWLRYRFFDRYGSHRPILVSGAAGIGKTALVKQFLASSRISSIPYWVNLEGAPDAEEEINRFIEYLYADIPRSNYIAVVDGCDLLSDEKMRHIIGRIYNIKATRGLIFIGRKNRNLKRAEQLNLGDLGDSDASKLIAKLMDGSIDKSSLAHALNLARGNPLAMSLLADLLKNGGAVNFESILSGKIYNFSNGISLPSDEIITSVRPKIISATDYLIQKLRKQPQSIYDLTPRKFEELLAELLTDMGWEVELTKATRDGGKDILAYLDTDVGKMLCLVEAKRYREDKKVGVDLVRSLYGTLYDHRASSAMLVTTSSFTAGAREFQRKYEYQLSLRDYGDLVQWIQNYKRI